MDNKMTRRLSYIVLTVLLFVLVFTSFSSITYADTATADSDVLTDLSLDETFTDADYPLNNNDYGLYVIQIAESTDKELLVYVYQPCAAKNFRASSINISTERDSQGVYSSPSNYFLTFCNNRGTLYKYKVNDFTVSNDVIRYYSIPQIMRRFDASIDSAAGYDNTISEVPCEVSKEWAFKYEDGNLVSSCLDTEVIQITDKLVGFIRYYDGWSPFSLSAYDHTDSHLVAFNTDRNMDELYEASIQWVSYSYKHEWHKNILNEIDYDAYISGDPIRSEVENLLYTNVVEQDSHGLFAHKYSFRQIQTIDELFSEEEMTVLYDGVFVTVKNNVEFDSEAKRALKNMSWVLRFTETGFGGGWDGEKVVEYQTRVSDVIILRLKFKSAGKIYDLPAIDNKQSGSTNPLGRSNYEVEVSDFLKTILLVLFVVLILIILFKFGPIIAGLLKAIFKIITFPIRAIIAAKKRRKEKKRDKQIDALIEASNRSKTSYRYRR